MTNIEWYRVFSFQLWPLHVTVWTDSSNVVLAAASAVFTAWNAPSTCDNRHIRPVYILLVNYGLFLTEVNCQWAECNKSLVCLYVQSVRSIITNLDLGLRHGRPQTYTHIGAYRCQAGRCQTRSAAAALCGRLTSLCDVCWRCRAVDRLARCVSDVGDWMSLSRLRLNSSKTQAIRLGHKNQIDGINIRT